MTYQIHTPRSILQVMGLVCILLLGHSPLLAAQSQNVHSLALTRRMILDKILPSELLSSLHSSFDAFDLGAIRVTSFAGKGTIQVKKPLKNTITRKIPSLWQIKIPASMDPNALDVEYHVNSCSGRSNALSLYNDSNVEIQVSIQPLRPTIVAIEPTATVTTAAQGNFYIVEGGVILRLYPEHLRESGSYCGTIQVSIYGG